jgi:hypothetical protein
MHCYGYSWRDEEMKKFHRKLIQLQARVFTRCAKQAKPLDKTVYTVGERADFHLHRFQNGYTPIKATHQCITFNSGNKAKILRSMQRTDIVGGYNRIWGNLYTFKAACFNFVMIRKGSPKRAR